MFIPYLGEKSKYSDFIIPHIPEEFSTFIEPFGGSMGVFFSLDLDKYPDVKFIYNDINRLNSNLFDYLRFDPDFMKIIKDIDVDELLFTEALGNLKGKSDINLAINWLIVLNCSYPKDLNTWKSKTSFENFKLKWPLYKNKIKRLSNIYTLDYKLVMDKYDSSNTFFYLDPPYKGKENYYINHNFSENSHYELSQYLSNIKGKFLLSYYYFDGIEEFYKGYSFNKKSNNMGTEYLIKNY